MENHILQPCYLFDGNTVYGRNVFEGKALFSRVLSSSTGYYPQQCPTYEGPLYPDLMALQPHEQIQTFSQAQPLQGSSAATTMDPATEYKDHDLFSNHTQLKQLEGVKRASLVCGHDIRDSKS